MDYLVAMKQFHAAAIAPYTGAPVGCMEEEVALLEQRVEFPLPVAYRQWLLWMGNDRRGIFVGTQCFISDVLENTQGLPDLLAENSIAYDLPEHYFAFYSHQGYAVAWFALPAVSDDPPVWFYTEGHDLVAPQEAGRFTDFILDDMRALARISQRDGDR